MIEGPVNPVAPAWGMGTGGAPVMQPPGGVSGTGGSASFSLQIPLPEITPIPDAHEFNPVGSIATAVVNAAPIAIPGAVFAVPSGNKAVIRGVTFYITNMLTTTNVTFSLLINGAPPAGYGNVSIFPRVAPFVGNGFECMLRFDGGVTVQAVFNNFDGGTYVVGASFSGWFWPQASDQRWKTFGPR